MCFTKIVPRKYFLIVNISLSFYIYHSAVPPPNVTIIPISVNIPINSRVTIACIVHSLTAPSVSWSTDTNMTLPSTSLVSNNDIHNSTLTLEQVTQEYSGKYTCTAENEWGEMSDMIHVIVDVDGK